MSNELKLSKYQSKNLELLSKLGSVEYVAKSTVDRVYTKEGELWRFFSHSSSVSPVAGVDVMSLWELERAGLVSSSHSTTYSKDFCKERRSKGPVGSWYKTVTVFTIN